MKGQTAGNSPVRIQLHRLTEIPFSHFKKTVVHRRTVLVPRSDLAAWYHRIGRILKVVFPFIGMGCCVLYQFPVVAGFVGGSIFAGINVHLMYRMMGIKPLFLYARKFPMLKEYSRMGYAPGEDPYAGFSGSHQWQFLRALFL